MALNVLLTENKEVQETTYPKLMIRGGGGRSAGDIVLFSEVGRGILLKSKSKLTGNGIGKFYNGFSYRSWVDYDGEITLSNLKE